MFLAIYRWNEQNPGKSLITKCVSQEKQITPIYMK